VFFCATDASDADCNHTNHAHRRATGNASSARVRHIERYICSDRFGLFWAASQPLPSAHAQANHHHGDDEDKDRDEHSHDSDHSSLS
jgi:hypothetical protein